MRPVRSRKRHVSITIRIQGDTGATRSRMPAHGRGPGGGEHGEEPGREDPDRWRLHAGLLWGDARRRVSRCEFSQPSTLPAVLGEPGELDPCLRAERAVSGPSRPERGSMPILQTSLRPSTSSGAIVRSPRPAARSRPVPTGAFMTSPARRGPGPPPTPRGWSRSPWSPRCPRGWKRCRCARARAAPDAEA